MKLNSTRSVEFNNENNLSAMEYLVLPELNVISHAPLPNDEVQELPTSKLTSRFIDGLLFEYI